MSAAETREYEVDRETVDDPVMGASLQPKYVGDPGVVFWGQTLDLGARVRVAVTAPAEVLDEIEGHPGVVRVR